MGTVADKLNYLNDTKKEIKQAIERTGTVVPTGTKFRQYAQKIDEVYPDALFVKKLQEKNLTFPVSHSSNNDISRFFYNKERNEFLHLKSYDNTRCELFNKINDNWVRVNEYTINCNLKYKKFFSSNIQYKNGLYCAFFQGIYKGNDYSIHISKDGKSWTNVSKPITDVQNRENGWHILWGILDYKNYFCFYTLKNPNNDYDSNFTTLNLYTSVDGTNWNKQSVTGLNEQNLNGTSATVGGHNYGNLKLYYINDYFVITQKNEIYFSQTLKENISQWVHFSMPDNGFTQSSPYNYIANVLFDKKTKKFLVVKSIVSSSYSYVYTSDTDKPENFTPIGKKIELIPPLKDKNFEIIDTDKIIYYNDLYIILTNSGIFSTKDFSNFVGFTTISGVNCDVIDLTKNYIVLRNTKNSTTNYNYSVNGIYFKETYNHASGTTSGNLDFNDMVFVTNKKGVNKDIELFSSYFGHILDDLTTSTVPINTLAQAYAEGVNDIVNAK